jgi:hypothetical protein
MRKRGMMKKSSSVSAVILVLACLYGSLEPVYSMDTALERQPSIDTTTLLLQQTNPEAGTVTPDIGVHHYDLNAEVVLTAVAKPSYRFLYWIGDVSDTTANSTIVYLDTPKIVIAVFERSEFELPKEELQNTLGGIGGARPSAGDYSNQAFEGGVRAQEFEWPTWEEEHPQPAPPEIPSEFPIPEDELPDDFPVPLPEPATILLLGLGSLLFVRCKTNRYT